MNQHYIPTQRSKQRLNDDIPKIVGCRTENTSNTSWVFWVVTADYSWSTSASCLLLLTCCFLFVASYAALCPWVAWVDHVMKWSCSCTPGTEVTFQTIGTPTNERAERPGCYVFMFVERQRAAASTSLTNRGGEWSHLLVCAQLLRLVDL